MIKIDLRDNYYGWMDLTIEAASELIYYDLDKESELEGFIDSLEDMLEIAKTCREELAK